MSEEIASLRVRIEGIVQGVGFREFLGKGEILDVSEDMGVKDAAPLFLVDRDSDEMDLARCSAPAS